ncbi:MAG: PIN domain-containing protein [Acidobacteria bacterium]|nr:PIN domain-containing protein [Acidobacteriota bacterium]
MSSRRPVFLDTNILVYAYDHSAPEKMRTARSIIEGALRDRSAVVSYQVVQEFLNVCTRKFRQVVSPEHVESQLRLLMRVCGVFPSSALYRSALGLQSQTGYSFYDSLVVASALEANCRLLLTEDLTHGRTIRGLEIRNPFLQG